MRIVPARVALLGALFAAVVTLPGLGEGTLWDNSETAYGEVAREILITHDWVVMHLNGQAWFVQPPLYFWVAALCAQVLGAGTLAMRLPAAVATIAMGGALGYATARVAGGRAGTVAAAVLATGLMQAIVGRLAIMDALLDLAVTAALLWCYRALEPAGAGALGPAGRARAFLLGSLALALGTLAKGPVAPVIVVLVAGAWLLWEWRLARGAGAGLGVVLPRPATVAAAVAVYLIVTLPWFAAEAVRVGPAAARELIGHYTVGRYTGVIENQRGPWWYYVPVVILGFFPWTAFVPAGFADAVARARRPEGSFARFALAWAILPFAFFSCAQTKLPNYVALLLPALAIVVALWFERVAEGAGRRAAIVSAATIPLFVGALGIALALFVRTNQLGFATAAVAGPSVVLALAMLGGSLATVAALAVPRWTAAAPYVLGATATALLLFIAFVAEPAAERLKPIPPLARAIDAARTPASVVALRSVSGANSLAFYTAPGVITLYDADADFATLICAHPDVFVITRASDGPALVQNALTHGRHAAIVEAAQRDALIRINGPACTRAAPSSSRAQRSVVEGQPKI